MYKYNTLIEKMIEVVMTDQEPINVIDWFAKHGQMISKKYFDNVLTAAICGYLDGCTDEYDLTYTDYGYEDDIEAVVRCEVWQVLRLQDESLVIDNNLLVQTLTTRDMAQG